MRRRLHEDAERGIEVLHSDGSHEPSFLLFPKVPVPTLYGKTRAHGRTSRNLEDYGVGNCPGPCSPKNLRKPSSVRLGTTREGHRHVSLCCGAAGRADLAEIAYVDIVLLVSLPICQDEARRSRVRADPGEVSRAPKVALQVRDSIVGCELQDQSLPLHCRLVRNEKHLKHDAIDVEEGGR